MGRIHPSFFYESLSFLFLETIENICSVLKTEKAQKKIAKIAMPGAESGTGS